MRRNAWLLGAGLGAMLLVSACGAQTKTTTTTAAATEAATTAAETTKQETTASEESMETTGAETTAAGEEVSPYAPDLDWIPQDFDLQLSEVAPREDIRTALFDAFQIPTEELSGTRYYYDTIDLNGDGKDEVVAFAYGDYTSGSGGTTMAILSEKDGHLVVTQSLTKMNAPVLVVDGKVPGVDSDQRVLIVRNDDDSYTAIGSKNGKYSDVEDGTKLTSLDGLKGSALVCNDIAADVDSDSALTLDMTEK